MPFTIFPLTILPRPSLLTSAVVAVSVASGLAFGTMAATALLIGARLAASRNAKA